MSSDPLPDLLEQSILALLPRVPERWSPLDRDALTATESRAVQALVLRGLIEVRASGRLVLGTDGLAYRLQFEVSGADGQRQVLIHICQELTNRGKEGCAFSVALDGDLEWRLHAHGQQAVADLTGQDPGLRRYARNFVVSAQPVRQGSRGSLTAFAPDEVPTIPATEPVPVRVANVEDLSNLLAQAISSLRPTTVPEVAPVPVPAPASAAVAAPAGKPTPAKRRGRHPARWTGVQTTTLLHYLLKNPSARTTDRIVQEVHAAGGGTPKEIRRRLRCLTEVGWTTTGDLGTCLNDAGILACTRKLGKRR